MLPDGSVQAVDPVVYQGSPEQNGPEKGIGRCVAYAFYQVGVRAFPFGTRLHHKGVLERSAVLHQMAQAYFLESLTPRGPSFAF